MMRRRPLLRAAAIGGAGYLAGKSAAQKSQQMNALEAQVQDLQAAQTAAPGAAPTPTGHPQPGMPGGPPPMPQAWPPATVAPHPAPAADRLAHLKQLGELRQAGVLTDEEFQKEKQRILGDG